MKANVVALKQRTRGTTHHPQGETSEFKKKKSLPEWSEPLGQKVQISRHTAHPTAVSDSQKSQNNWGHFTEFGLGYQQSTVYCIGRHKKEKKEDVLILSRGSCLQR